MADGLIVGSAIVRRVAEAAAKPRAAVLAEIGDYVGELLAALSAGGSLASPTARLQRPVDDCQHHRRQEQPYKQTKLSTARLDATRRKQANGRCGNLRAADLWEQTKSELSTVPLRSSSSAGDSPSREDSGGPSGATGFRRAPLTSSASSSPSRRITLTP